MSFPTVFDLKNHLNLTSDEIEYDAELPRHLAAAKEKVLAYVNRGVYVTLPAEPESSDIVVNDSIKRAIIEIAGYYFDQKGAIDIGLDAFGNLFKLFIKFHDIYLKI